MSGLCRRKARRRQSTNLQQLPGTNEIRADHLSDRPDLAYIMNVTTRDENSVLGFIDLLVRKIRCNGLPAAVPAMYALDVPLTDKHNRTTALPTRCRQHQVFPPSSSIAS